MSALFRLELRRGLRAPLALCAAALVLLLALTSGEGDGARQTLWVGALLLFVPATTLHAASLLPRWRAGEGDWIGARPITRGAALVGAWSGVVAAGVLWLLVGALLVEGLAGEPSEDLRLVWQHDLDQALRLDPGQGQRVELSPPVTGAGDRLRLRVRASVGAAPTTDARVLAARDGDGQETRARIATRTWIELPAPQGKGKLLLQVDDLGEGAMAWLSPNSVELWRPTATPLAASLALWWRGALLMAALGALALGASAWVGVPAACGAALSALPLGAVLAAPGWWPGRGLLEALTILGEGRVPSTGGIASLGAGLLFVALGLGSARTGLASWRHGR